MCVHAHVCIRMCVYVHMCVCIFVCICMCLHTYVCICAYVRVHICMHMYVCAYIIMCVYVHVCLCIFVCICKCVHTYVYTYMCKYAFMSNFLVDYFHLSEIIDQNQCDSMYIHVHIHKLHTLVCCECPTI